MKKTLEITEQQAKELYPTASQDFKKLLELNFGIKTFCKNILEVLISYEAACDILGKQPMDFTGIKAYKVAQEKLETIIEAANEGWFPDYSNDDQKWYVWFGWRSGAFRFDGTYCARTLTRIGSRLCCKTEEIAKTIAKRFESDWDIYLKGK